MAKYDAGIDLSNRNNSHTLIVELVGANKRVLDVGCATGYIARALRDRGCTVSGLEADPEAAEVARPHLDQLVVADLEETDLVDVFGERTFDVVVFGDVLEHLRDPLPTLRQARRLVVDQGAVVVSIPNIAHGSVRLSLLNGRFDYQPLGLLDTTHLRFFTRDSMEALMRDAGLVPVDVRRTTAGLFDTPIPVREDEFPPEVVESVLADPEALTFQFVLRAVRDDAGSDIAALHAREEEQRLVIADLRRSLAESDRARTAGEARTQELEKLVADLEGRLEEACNRLSEVRTELDLVMQTRTMRYSRGARQAYSRLRQLYR